MVHLTVSEPGLWLGLESERLVLKKGREERGQYPLSRLKTITVFHRGTGMSGQLLMACAARGIRLFLTDFRGKIVAGFSTLGQHAVCATRRAQFAFLEAEASHRLISGRIVFGKIRNQRAVLLYFLKNRRKKSAEAGEEAGLEEMEQAADSLREIARSLKNREKGIASSGEKYSQWLLGQEGNAARVYWGGLRSGILGTDSFKNRVGRGATDPVNQALNYGYAVLITYVWNALINAGLEVYAGVFHRERPGRPGLVLDVMEEYRAWTVDRNIIKLKNRILKAGKLEPALKKKIIAGVHETFARKYPYKGKKVILESILQRQCYRLAGTFAKGEAGFYKPYLFRW